MATHKEAKCKCCFLGAPVRSQPGKSPKMSLLQVPAWFGRFISAGLCPMGQELLCWEDVFVFLSAHRTLLLFLAAVYSAAFCLSDKIKKWNHYWTGH